MKKNRIEIVKNIRIYFPYNKSSGLGWLVTFSEVKSIHLLI